MLIRLVRTVVLSRKPLQQNDDEQRHDDVGANGGDHDEVQDRKVAARVLVAVWQHRGTGQRNGWTAE